MKGSTRPPASTLAGFGLHSLAFPSVWLALSLCVLVLPARADVLIGTNGDRFAGRVVQETADSVVFDSELRGTLTISRSLIRKIQRLAFPVTDKVAKRLDLPRRRDARERGALESGRREGPPTPG